MNRAIFIACVLIGLGHATVKKLLDLIPSAINPLNGLDSVGLDSSDAIQSGNLKLLFGVLYVNRCIEDYGCFYTGPPFFNAINRPISLPPTYNVEGIKFHLFTPSNPDEEYELKLNPESLASSSFDPKLETKLLIHGFLTKNEAGDVRHKTKDEMLKIGHYNVIIVDWADINGPPYAQAVANARLVGAVTAKLIHIMMNVTSITPERFHIIGHSLGGHVGGYIGRRVPHIGRITGLDPAGPYFQNAGAEVRLDPSDASFVDVIHTDGAECFIGGLGMTEPIGHMDFYPNGGRLQPGCAYNSPSETVVGAAVNWTTRFLAFPCAHSRANQYFLETIDNAHCHFLSVLCSSYKDFETGECPPQSSKVAEMGFHNKRISGLQPPAKFYLRTHTKSPFCNQDSINL